MPRDEYEKKKHFAKLAECFNSFGLLSYILVRYVGEKCHLSCSLDSYVELSLMKSASTGYTSGEDLSSLRGELSELSNILVIDIIYLILAEDANFLSSVVLAECGTLIFVSFHFGKP